MTGGSAVPKIKAMGPGILTKPVNRKPRLSDQLTWV